MLLTSNQQYKQKLKHNKIKKGAGFVTVSPTFTAVVRTLKITSQGIFQQ
jgi:hypothetical protein